MAGLGAQTQRWFASAALASLLALSPAQSKGEAQGKAASAATQLDEVVVRWYAPETGGAAKPRFVFARELAFEARLESFADPDPEPGPYHDRHIRAALDRHIAETLLAGLPIVPAPKPTEVAERVKIARAVLEARVRHAERIADAAKAEGIGKSEIDAMLERQARASLYLDRMVAPMLKPSDLELRELYRSGTTPFSGSPFDEVAEGLSIWYVGQRLSQAVETYYQNARARVVITMIRRPRARR